MDRMHDPTPWARVLGNGRYSVLLTGAGTGRSRWGRLSLTSWRPDRVEDASGVFLWLRVEGGAPSRLVGSVRTRPGVVTLSRTVLDVEASVDVCVVPDADVELRVVRLRNRGASSRRVEVTSCLEVVLNDFGAHAAHPAFSKLFVQTERDGDTLLARRRPRSEGDHFGWMVHALSGAFAFETDRVRFVGRGRSVTDPAFVMEGTVGSVLDPVMAMRREVVVGAGETVSLVALVAAADERAAALALARRFTSVDAAEAGIAAAVAAEVERRARFELDDALAEGLQALAGAVEYRHPALRAGGDVPASPYLLELGVTCPEVPGAAADVQRAVKDAPAPAGRMKPSVSQGLARSIVPLQFDNGYGGFSEDGREYVIRVDGARRPPMPWVNVLANDTVGCIVSEAGAASTWSRNGHEYRLTPWTNDPVSDPHGEALYVRDDDAGEFWSPQPGPVGAGSYEVAHGFGYTRWRHESHGIEHEVRMFVPVTDPVRVVSLRLKNVGAARRRMSVASYARLVLGVEPGLDVVTGSDASKRLLLAQNPKAGVFASGITFAGVVVDDAAKVSLTSDRAAFIGRGGSPSRPEALCAGGALNGRTGEGLDACAVFLVPFTLEPGATFECSFLLGEVTESSSLEPLWERWRLPGAVDAALEALATEWKSVLGAVEVETPSPALNLMMNGWLLYQSMSSRLRGRNGFYQSSGAFGFRDQLQDVSALVYSRPDLTRKQILLHAAHQFPEGDVLHWWHPPNSIGIRTRFSDDLLWLPYVTEFYARTTGDASVFDEVVGFMSAPELKPGQDEEFLTPSVADASATVFEHCALAIDRSLTAGAHGLPLMGTGDWNDGMNRVGREGRGESVWLGFFFCVVLDAFVPIAEARGESERASRWGAYRASLAAALNDAGWDGEWYRRAYYDDGTPLGSSSSDECRIDAIAQAWAVISGVAPAERAVSAMRSAERMLVDREAGIVRLLTPPFDRTSHDPGYIKGYVPGIRENGGQYTHAACWVVRAMAELGWEQAGAVLEMMLPVGREASSYCVEPYVVAADVYGVAPHVGRGGWTWYTGSAAWMYRVALESVLGVRVEGGVVHVAPCMPAGWTGFRVQLMRPGGAVWDVNVRRGAVAGSEVDGAAVSVEGGAVRLTLADDAHRVDVTVPSA
ncbi:MAG TPA: glycosyl transferase [Candidatus Binatia bacterium]|jgi:cyclic beta-1,2-glucan synthetase|nr:glycosyl transferase [Candidatus Binatia bacterium]